ncbi:MAG: hypothetical protein HYV52_00150 [Parcubacteria group bacterium]|nr:hypothetical protein [Parcubacteria group bacterium]
MSRRYKGRNKRQQKLHEDWHHVYPRSRHIHKTGVFCILCDFRLHKRIDDHRSWHCLFVNKYPEEVIEKLWQATDENGKIKKYLIINNSKNQLKAWHILFQDLEDTAFLVNIIKRYWMYPGARLEKGPDKQFSRLVFDSSLILKRR